MTEKEYFDHVRGEDPDVLVPPMVDGSYMTLTEYSALTSWASAARELDERIRGMADEESWIRAVGYAYVSAERDVRAQTGEYPSVPVFSDLVWERATENIEASLKTITHYIACYLMDDPSPKAFRIGPVEFIPGAELASRIQAELGGSPAWLPEYMKLASGDSVADTATRTYFTAKDVYDMSKYPWIVVVEVTGFEPAMSLRRANDAARLGVASLGLLLHPKSLAKLGLVNEWGRQLVTRTMAQIRGGDIFGGSRNDRPQVQLSSGIREILHDCRGYLDSCGELIAECLTHAVEPRALRESWLNALHWYYSGCVEPSDARAAICFSTAFESLARTDGAEGIVELLEILFATDRRSTVVPSLGWSLEQTVAEIYGAARSEVVHGGRFVIFREYQRARNIAADLCRKALIVTHEKLHEYEAVTRRRAEADSRSHFLSWMRARSHRHSVG